MRVILAAITFLALTICYADSQAGVRMITESRQNTVASKNKPSSFDNSYSTQTECYKAGFKKSSCSGNLKPAARCPYDSKYFRDCCPEDYKFKKSYCTSRGMVPSSNSCAGLYACEKY